MHRQSTTDRDGAALLIVVAFIMLSTVLAAALLISSRSHAHVGSAQLNMEKAMYLAEAGAERAAAYIDSQRGYLPPTYTESGQLSDGSYTYTVKKTAWRMYEITSTGTAHGKTRQVHIARAYIPTYAKYALWMDRNGRIYFIPGEEFHGHVHSNDHLWFSSSAARGGPVFWREVSTAKDKFKGTPDWAEFHMGFELDADEGELANIDFNSADPFSLLNLADRFGMVLEGETTIEFQDDLMKITNTRKGWNNEPVFIGEDQIVYVKDAETGDSEDDGAIHLVGGTVDGRVTLVAEDDILINDHIRYSQDPTVFPDSKSALGLVAQDDVWVTTSAPNNLDLHGAILAAGVAQGDGSFGVLEYNRNAPRGALNVFGSIVQDKRGAVGTFKTSGMSTGYYKNYSFDDRFVTEAPPYYPVVDDQIRFDGWWEGPTSS